ncbi:pyruvate dehydrogenase (acetyl-transferring) E1 component subunit alpha [Methylosinus sporium]|uniref:Pyruvate dehydrogenase E1 component subunit alpha n=1 Tax=Methylosinus sporium TaxID=428 RepID=A0A549T2T1_METSR|nr:MULTISPECIES: pyruvate dehydrogenase (acetyl-transferring) E1 component subunit alpha [Methylosinus]MBU3889453.1 pyruvate dehydrogenase (acetyl-transferring) E1 component subunit alpha [Methylosinus sp. KRF6]TRL36183.1 pyruvate dehydrogenase (acetyl-transferring) E1 component subunit alpha [Methylosinus sporium]
MTIGVSFQIDFLRFLSASGELDPATPREAIEAELLLGLYRAMTRTRAYDGKAIALQRTGKLGTFASALGQEAIGVGIGSAMRGEDVLAPSYRDHGAQLLRGMTMVENLVYWGGDERGSDYAVPRSDFPICVPVGTQIAHAAGAAYAFALRKEKRVAVTIIGDGGASTGDFYSALNMAGVWRVPLVVVINNNQWAISTPRERESATATLAQKAVAAGVEGCQVDGNDVIAMRHVARSAIEKARDGGGPTLIEALSYRLGDHTTADDASRYRDGEIVRREAEKEPIARLRKYLTTRGLWNEEREARLAKDCAEEVERAVAAYLATPPQEFSAMFDHLFAHLPESMRDQYEEARRFAPKGGGNG